jgi:hypothetical protein
VRVADVAHQLLEVVLVLDEFVAQRVEQFGIDGGLLTRTSSTGSTMPLPKKWAQTRLATFRGEERVVGRSEPFRPALAAIFAGTSGSSPPRNFGFMGARRPG